MPPRRSVLELVAQPPDVVPELACRCPLLPNTRFQLGEAFHHRPHVRHVLRATRHQPLADVLGNSVDVLEQTGGRLDVGLQIVEMRFRDGPVPARIHATSMQCSRDE